MNMSNVDINADTLIWNSKDFNEKWFILNQY